MAVEEDKDVFDPGSPIRLVVPTGLKAAVHPSVALAQTKSRPDAATVVQLMPPGVASV